ncbi:MAG: AraC family transcriptional regulator [Prevotella sp.]|nr:AraC family transcriptional regulator [Prevotella sp.]
MKERIITSVSMLLLATPFCFANGYTLADANHIIVILIVIVIVLVVLGGYSLYHNRVISQRNEQLRRILTALDNYRAIVGDEALSLDEQEEVLKKKLSKPKNVKVVKKGEEQSFFVKMDARINKEKPFTDPNFDHDALVEFMGVTHETFCKLAPRYQDPDRTLDYINSLRAEYAAKLLMEHSDFSTDDIACQCGFRDAAAFNKAFKFAFGITSTDYLSSMSKMFKKKRES